MKVTKINAFFASFARFQIRHRVAFLAGIAIITILCCSGLPRLKLSANESDWFEDWEETKINEDRFKEYFESQDSLALLVQSDNVFDRDVLQAIKDIGEELEQNVPFAKSVTSLTDLSLPVGNDDGFEVISPFEDGIPLDDEELRSKKDFIMSRHSLVNNIVSDDATETWIILSLYSYEEDLGTAMYKIAPPAMKIINDEKYKSEKFTLKPIGLSYTEYEEDMAVGQECKIRIGIGFLIMVACLIFFVRSFRGFIVPLLATVFALCSVLGASAWLGIEGSSMLIVLPVLLSMALSVGYSIHYINSFRMHFRRTGLRKDSVIKAVEESGWPIFFTVVTTMASVLSFMFSGISQIRWVGGCTAACVFAVFLYVIILIPIFMSYGKDKAVSSQAFESKGATKADLLFEKGGTLILRRKWIVMILSALVVGFMIPAFTKIKVNMDYIEMMGGKVPYVARVIEITKAKIGSQYDYDVMIEFPGENDIKKADVFERIDELSERIGKLKTTKISGNKPRITSVTSIVKEMNRTLNSDDEAFYAIPQDDEELAQMLFMYEISGGEDLYDWVDDDFTRTHIHISMTGYNADDVVHDINLIKSDCAALFPDAKCSVIGEVVNFAEMNKKLVMAELKSFALSFIIILILMSIAFVSLRTGLIGMIPNIAPVVLIGGLMGHFAFSLDMMTMTIMPMILGIAVDDTIHFTNHIKFYFEKNGSYLQSIIASYREIGKTMVMTTVILCSMFLLLSFSPITCIGRIGIMSVVGLAGALVADYTLTPVLMLLCEPFGREKKASKK